ncbi:MAG: hypothetical protein ACE5KE_06540 [Methanosarcinales archaeon]
MYDLKKIDPIFQVLKILKQEVSLVSIRTLVEKTGLSEQMVREGLEYLKDIDYVVEDKKGFFSISRGEIIKEYLKDYSAFSISELKKAIKRIYERIASIRKEYNVVNPSELRIKSISIDNIEGHKIWEDLTDWEAYLHMLPIMESALIMKYYGLNLDKNVSKSTIQ